MKRIVIEAFHSSCQQKLTIVKEVSWVWVSSLLICSYAFIESSGFTYFHMFLKILNRRPHMLKRLKLVKTKVLIKLQCCPPPGVVAPRQRANFQSFSSFSACFQHAGKANILAEKISRLRPGGRGRASALLGQHWITWTDQQTWYSNQHQESKEVDRVRKFERVCECQICSCVHVVSSNLQEITHVKEIETCEKLKCWWSCMNRSTYLALTLKLSSRPNLV
jgi:hypothetical protein